MLPVPSKSPDRGTLRAWLRAFWPAPIAVDWHERLRVTAGAVLGMLATALLCHTAEGASAWPWLVAPMGASAVLIFGVPASPLAQPWAVVGGNTLSALVGVACARWVAPPELAAALAVGLAIALMFALRCLHPPGGASALLVALSGVTDPRFALFPVLVNSILLVLAGIAYNNATRRAYPHMQLPPAEAARAATPDPADAELDAVIARYNQVLDISRDDLKALLEDTRLRAYQRQLADVRCRDIMSRAPITVSRGTPLQQAFGLFRQHRIKALPVVDAAGGIVGIVTPADFMRAEEPVDAQALGPGGVDTVGRIMSRQVRVVSQDRHLADLIPLFGSSGHHHIPVVGEGDRLVGIITQSDVVAALSQATRGS